MLISIIEVLLLFLTFLELYEMMSKAEKICRSSMYTSEGGVLMKRYVVVGILAILFFTFSLPVLAQSTDDINALKKEIEALKESQKAIQKDIQEIKGQLRARQAPPEFKEAVIELGNNPFKGDKSAKVTLIEFSDYQ